MRRTCAILALALAVGGAAAAGAFQSSSDRLILSNDWGYGATIGGMEDLREDLPPADLAGTEIVAEFKRLCLDTNFDSAGHAQAALGSTWGFQRHEAVLPAAGKQAAFALTDYRSPSAITSLWRGENGEALKGRAYAARSRGAIITGPAKAKDLPTPQCNLSVATRGVSDAAPIAAALEQALGQPAAKVVFKSGFADGNWKVADPSGLTRRVSFDVVDMKKAIQLVHFNVQILPAAK